MKKILPIIILLLFHFSDSISQSKCGTDKYRQRFMARNAKKLINNSFRKSDFQLSENDTLNIAVVVHVVYKENIENISQELIQSQIEVINKDFALKNSDADNVPEAWKSLQKGMPIKFHLAKLDPLGNPTNGITRTQTQKDGFNEDSLDMVKFESTGGKSNWDPNKYLNIWVCNIKGQTLGIAVAPDQSSSEPEYDGVIIRYEAFGKRTTPIDNFEANNLGRTTTHEIGHWLGLFHIWGDGNATNCGNDEVDDTPPADAPNYGKPNFPHKVGAACTTDPNGQMFMNYMDYTDDEAMYMFTNGQTSKMLNAITNYRSTIVNNTATGITSITSKESQKLSFSIYPNPNNGNFGLKIINSSTVDIKIFAVDGSIIYQNQKFETTNGNLLSISQKGIYSVIVNDNGKIGTQKVIIK